jgi:hypothetical protein
MTPAGVPSAAFQKRTVTIAFTDFADLAEGVTSHEVDLGAVLPDDARYLGHTIGESFTGFSDGATATYVLKVGSDSDDDSIVTTVNVAAGQTGFPKTGTAGVEAVLMRPLANETYKVVITSSEDLNTATAGSVKVNLFYTVRS